MIPRIQGPPPTLYSRLGGRNKTLQQGLSRMECCQGGLRDDVQRTRGCPLSSWQYVSKNCKRTTPYISVSGLCLLWREEKFPLNHFIAAWRVKFRTPCLPSSLYISLLPIITSLTRPYPHPWRALWVCPAEAIGTFLGLPKKLPVGGSSFIYSHHLPSGFSPELQNHKFQTKPPESSLRCSSLRGEGTSCLCLHSCSHLELSPPRHSIAFY